jgi:hypothetical protein
MELLSDKKFLWIIILALLILNLASLATIWVREWGERDSRISESRPPIARDHFLKKRLNFSPEQQVEFDTLLSKHRSQLELKADEIRSLRKELMSMMRNQEFSQESEEIVHMIGQKQSELELLNYNHFEDVMAICNDKQKQVFIETLKRVVGPHHRHGDHNLGDDDFRRPGNRRKR